MTKNAKCTVCGYTIAIPNDKSASDYICPNDGSILAEATEAEYNTYISETTLPLFLNIGKTWAIPENHHLMYVLGPGQSLSGSDTITGGGSLILFSLG